MKKVTYQSIIKEVTSDFKDSHNTLILSDRSTHIAALKELDNELLLINPIKSSEYIAGVCKRKLYKTWIVRNYK